MLTLLYWKLVFECSVRYELLNDAVVGVVILFNYSLRGPYLTGHANNNCNGV